MRKNAENFIVSADYDLGTAEHMLNTGRYIKDVISWLKRNEKLKK